MGIVEKSFFHFFVWAGAIKRPMGLPLMYGFGRLFTVLCALRGSNRPKFTESTKFAMGTAVPGTMLRSQMINMHL